MYVPLKLLKSANLNKNYWTIYKEHEFLSSCIDIIKYEETRLLRLAEFHVPDRADINKPWRGTVCVSVEHVSNTIPGITGKHYSRVCREPDVNSSKYCCGGEFFRDVIVRVDCNTDVVINGFKCRIMRRGIQDCILLRHSLTSIPSQCVAVAPYCRRHW
jgi:hypothetical protein